VDKIFFLKQQKKGQNWVKKGKNWPQKFTIKSKKVDKGGCVGGKPLIHQRWIKKSFFFLNSSLSPGFKLVITDFSRCQKFGDSMTFKWHIGFDRFHIGSRPIRKKF